MSVFEHHSEVQNHWWWRPGWRVGRRIYAFHVTFDGHHGLHRLAARYRQALAGFESLTLVPDRWLHLTVQGIGFADEIPGAAVDALIADATTRLAELPPVVARLCEVVVAEEAVALPVVPADPIRRIRSVSRDAIGHVFGTVEEDLNRFLPHVTVAYVAATGAAEPYVAAVEAVHVEPVHVAIDHVDLIEIHRDNRMYEWRVVASIPLATPDG